MKFHRADGKMHLPRNLLIGKLLEEFTKHFLLTSAEHDRRLEDLAITNEFIGALSQTAEQVFLCRDHYTEFIRNLAVQHAIDCDQTGGVIDRQTPIPVRSHLKAP